MKPLKPSFTTTGDVTYKQPSAANAQVSGTGDYVDQAGNKATPVRFVWTFTRDDAKSEWLLINAFGAPS